jgi:hypothetical protein
MSAGFEVGGVSHGSNERGGCDHADARDRHDPPASLDLARNESQFLLDLDQLGLDLPELLDQASQIPTQDWRHACVSLIFDHRRQQAYVVRPVWPDNSEFSEMAAQSTDAEQPFHWIVSSQSTGS